MSVAETEVLLDDDLIERDFNDALASLQKSLKSPAELRKAKKDADEEYDEEKSEDEETDEEEEDEETDEEEEDEDEGMEKSISDIVSEDPEAAAAMEVSQFLGQLVKAIDESVSEVFGRVRNVERMMKSQGALVAEMAKLEKSTRDLVKSIGGQPMPTKGVRTLKKSRFETDGEVKDFDNSTVLIKSRDWVKTGKINMTEAGMIEGRINKNRLGRVNDRLDQKVVALMREDS